MEGGEHAVSDGFAMEESAVVESGFEGVGEGVAEVEEHAFAGFVFVAGNDGGFDADGGENDALQESRIAMGDRSQVAGEEREQGGIADEGALDTFGEAGAEFSRGESGEGGGVGEDGARRMDAAEEIFSFGKIDAGLATDGGVNLREECSGEGYVVHAALIDGGEKSGEVGDDASAECDQHGIAMGAGAGELGGEALDGCEGFVAFAGRNEEDDGTLGAGEGFEEHFAVEAEDLRRGDEEAGAVAKQGMGSGAGEEAGSDRDGVGTAGALNFDEGGRGSSAL
jgi:hypothetical protein